MIVLYLQIMYVIFTSRYYYLIIFKSYQLHLINYIEQTYMNRYMSR